VSNSRIRLARWPRCLFRPVPLCDVANPGTAEKGNPSRGRRHQSRCEEAPSVSTSEHQPTLSACSSSIDDGVGLPGLNGQGANRRGGLLRFTNLAAAGTKGLRWTVMGRASRPYFSLEARNARSRTGSGWGTRGNRADRRARQRAGIEYAASRRGAGTEYRAGVGWWRFGRPLGGYQQPPNSRSRPPMEWGRARASLGAEWPSFRLGSVWLARCPYVLGLGTQRRRFRLSIRR
jgi:hypothetical protein